MPVAAFPHMGMTIYVLINTNAAFTGEWLQLDPPGKLILLVVSTLFLFCSLYAVPYLMHRKERPYRLFIV